ncbi:cytochrome P450 [Annulohypoxylon maeteangense]|uniref:cytochrome P450 n=1 Tax=Annulohypoxylon maeteangense TaxID=1927788 RepID=UPI002007E40F|nr:cytochrome P450 [Annulohypoxylon maeteangense]KAI0889734.1 cytochrome P450 [Annulohypoxylon maeteangense]
MVNLPTKMAVVPNPLNDLATFDKNLLLPLAKLLFFAPAILLIIYVALNEVVRLRARIRNLPGPWGYPLFGSILSLRGTATSDEYRIWAERYGDVFQVQLGNTTAVIVNSIAAARALFITQREATNSRPVFYVLHKKVQQDKPIMSIGTSPWNESCKRRRKVAATALNKTSTESYYPILDLESRAFIADILSSCGGGKETVHVLDLARKFALNLSLTLAYGTRVEDVKDLHQDLMISEILYIEGEITKFRNPTSNYSNYIPLLRPIYTIAGWFGLQKGSHMADIGKRRYAYHRALQEKLRKDIAAGTDRPCIQGNVLKDPESKGLTENELLSVGLSMLAGADTTKRSIMWAIVLLAHRRDIQDKAYQAIKEADPRLLQSPNVAHTRVPYIEAFTKEVGRYFVVQRLALPKATYSEVQWNGATIPPNTLVFLNAWACTRDPSAFSDPNIFAPERWMSGEQTANHHQFAFGIGGRMCVASHVATKALYAAFFHLIAHFEVFPAEDTSNPIVADPIEGLLTRENPIAGPKARTVRFVPRNADVTREMIFSGDF